MIAICGMTVLEHPGLSDIGKWFDLQVRPQQLHPVVDSVSGSSHSGMSVSSLGSSMSGSSLLSSMPAVPSPPIMMPQGQTFQPFMPAPAPAPASQILPQETRVSAAVTLSFLTNCGCTVGISTNLCLYCGDQHRFVSVLWGSAQSARAYL